MKIFCYCVVKNEEDIIGLTLSCAAGWADKIFIIDNDSDDDTWKIIQKFANRYPEIVIPHSCDARPFGEFHRQELFNSYRHLAKEGDWWCLLDGDEIYEEDPRNFLSKVATYHHVVWALHFTFYLTQEDIGFPNSKDQFEYLDELPKHYISNGSEFRFYRYRSRLVWKQGAHPRHLGLVAPQRIQLRHYQCRSPRQIQRRVETRLLTNKIGSIKFPHVTVKDWKVYLKSPDQLRYLENGKKLIADLEMAPHHLEKWPVRIAKRVLHGLNIWP